jgi:hypothetical protein
MPLLTDEDRAALPPLYATEGQGDEAPVVVRLFAPGTIWQWLVCEFDGDDLLFGLACGPYIEPGYFSLSELAASGHVVRDAAWRPQPLGKAQAAVEASRR